MSDQHTKDQLEYYDKHTADYEKGGLLQRGLSRAYERKARIIHEQLVAIGANRVLEIGAGSGLMTYFLVNMFDGEYVALDLSAEMLKVAENRINNDSVKYVIGDGTAPEFEEASFDAIVGVDIIHHIENPITAFANWKGLVRPGGQMIFLETNVYNPLNLRNIGVEHEVRSFLNTDKNLTKWSKEGGWGSVSVTPSPSYTPSGPRLLEPLFDFIDRISVKIPLWNRLTALWLIVNTK
tara:strand:+ start:360 stop:1070 length:711 start_codon:yes stop_codon:yes gene_type:complete